LAFYYNLTITALSVTVALGIGTIELVGAIGYWRLAGVENRMPPAAVPDGVG